MANTTNKIALTPTSVYTIREITDIGPNKNATKSNPNKPTKPQFNAPIKHNADNIFIIISIENSFR